MCVFSEAVIAFLMMSVAHLSQHNRSLRDLIYERKYIQGDRARACVRVCVCACVRARVCVCMARVYVCLFFKFSELFFSFFPLTLEEC